MKKLLMKKSIAAGISLLALSACDHQNNNDSAEMQTTSASFERMLVEKFAAEDKLAAKEGLEALESGDLKLASQRINSSLIDYPSNSFLHFVNGLIYHLMAKKGDITKYELAKAGFEQSIKFNSSNLDAHLQLARVHMEEKNYHKSQDSYAAVLLLKPDHSDALLELANASYYAVDMRTAQMAINRVLRKNPGNADVRKAAVMIFSAAGKDDLAKENFDQYKKIVADSKPLTIDSLKHTFERSQNWRTLYEKGLVLAQADESSSQESDSAQPDFGAPAPEGGQSTSAAPAQPRATSNASPKEDNNGKMIVVDAVTMRVSEQGSTSKGNNILDRFAVTIAPGSHMLFRNSSTPGGPGGSVSLAGPAVSANGINGVAYTALAGNAGTVGSTRLFAQGITFGAIQYSLNIANASRQYIEIIGRPSLTASIGSPEPAKFFSGQQLTLGLAPQAGGSAGSIQRLPVGVTLEVNAVSLEKGFVILDISIYGSAINSNDLRNPDGSVANPTAQFTPINLSKIRTRVKVKLGETVMLGGITERLESQNKSGFPGLQDVPLLQYLFSREDTSSERKSVVYLLTPRTYESNKQAIKTLANRDDQPYLKELEVRNTDWYDPAYNMALSLSRLSVLHNEFRTGDMPPLNWDMKANYETQVAQASSFLYF